MHSDNKGNSSEKPQGLAFLKLLLKNFTYQLKKLLPFAVRKKNYQKVELFQN